VSLLRSASADVRDAARSAGRLPRQARGKGMNFTSGRVNCLASSYAGMKHYIKIGYS
jgi:hypothetical protein